jgi:hypothetical protein
LQQRHGNRVLDEVESGSRTIHGRAALHDAHQALPVRDEVRIVRKHRGGRACQGREVAGEGRERVKSIRAAGRLAGRFRKIP